MSGGVTGSAGCVSSVRVDVDRLTFVKELLFDSLISLPSFVGVWKAPIPGREPVHGKKVPSSVTTTWFSNG